MSAEAIQFPTNAQPAVHAITEKGFFGSKFDGNRSPVDCAKLIRADIKAAIASGALPKGKYSVITRHYNAIDIKVSALPFIVLNRKRVSFDTQYPHVSMSNQQMDIYTDLGRIVLKTLTALVNQYNRDQSDSMTDYFSVHFYDSVGFDWEWTNAQQKEIAAQEKANPSWEFTVDEERRLRSWRQIKAKA